MSPHRLTNIALACTLALMLSASYLLDGPTELEAAHTVQADKADAINTARKAHTTAQAEVLP